MDRLGSHEIIVMFLALGTLLASARLLGETARKLGLPSVAGEILAGVLLGPTVLGTLAPGFSAFLFPSNGVNAVVLHGFTTLAIALFLLVAGMEIDLSSVWRQGRAALTVGLAGVFFPFSIGFLAAWFMPEILGMEAGANHPVFSLFIATALSITALPVIAKVLMDLNLYRSDLGMIIIAAAALGDLIGWTIFATILGMIDQYPAGENVKVHHIVLLTTGSVLVILTVGRRIIGGILVWVQERTSWPGGVLGYALSLGLFGAALTEWIGIHAIFGAFLVGIAIGDSPHLKERTRSVISEFISFIFAPLFFACIGLRVNFAVHFDFILVLLLFSLTVAGKLTGCSLGARWSGLPRRESLAIGSGMVAQGTMGIILGIEAFHYGVIGEKVFVAVVVVSLATSMVCGPAMHRILRRTGTCSFTDYLSGDAPVHHLKSTSRDDAIRELVGVLCASSFLDAREVEKAVLAREETMHTGVGNGVAVPHARLPALITPLVCLGLSRDGIDFDAPDGEPAQIILLILTPIHDDCAQLEILADSARIFSKKEIRNRAMKVTSYSDFLNLVEEARKESRKPEKSRQG